jgi:hypothetical protein
VEPGLGQQRVADDVDVHLAQEFRHVFLESITRISFGSS